MELTHNSDSNILASPKIIENYQILQETGISAFIDILARDIYNYRTLLTKGLEIFNCTSIADIMDATIEQISYHFLPSYIAFLWKPIQNRPEITIRAYKNYKPVDIDIKVDNITVFESFFIEHPKEINFENLAKELNKDEELKPYKEINPKMVIPIIGPFGLYGIILVGHKSMGGEYNDEEMEFLHHLMAFMSQAIKNNLHYEHSLRDAKTGLYNHGFFIDRLNVEVIQTKRNAYSSSIIVADVDKFKYFNDNYGHLAGDQVLEKLALVIKQSVRTNDIPSRFGGEEFTIMLPHTDSSIAWIVAERLRVNVAKMQVPWEIFLPQVTISLGVFSFDQDSNLNSTDILRRADEALYISKASGRNRSTIWEAGLLAKLPPQ